MGLVTFTTTIPIEIVFAAGEIPLDLNNLFITSENPSPLKLVEDAEVRGFPRSSCAWIKGLYSTLGMNDLYKKTDLFVAVTEGDCTNARVLMEIVKSEFNIRTYLFSYPYSRDPREMKRELEKFASFMGTSLEDASKIKSKKLNPIRKKLSRMDKLSYTVIGSVSGFDNHLLLVSASDFWGEKIFEYEAKIDETLKKAKNKSKQEGMIPLAFFGVPPIFNPYDVLEEFGAIVTYNEIQREFAMLNSSGKSLEEQYLNYTYPYDAKYRFSKALNEAKKRNVKGIIHYVQSFCHRQIEDILLREIASRMKLNVPIITLEGDKPIDEIDGRLRTRLEAFVESVRRR